MTPDRTAMEPFMQLDRTAMEPFVPLDRTAMEPFMPLEFVSQCWLRLRLRIMVKVRREMLTCPKRGSNSVTVFVITCGYDQG